MLVALLGCTLAGLVGAAIGQSKRRPGEAFFLGFFLGPIGWLLVATGPSSAPKCPHCGGTVDAGFTACRHCGRDIDPVDSSPFVTGDDTSLNIAPPPVRAHAMPAASCFGVDHAAAERAGARRRAAGVVSMRLRYGTSLALAVLAVACELVGACFTDSSAITTLYAKKAGVHIQGRDSRALEYGEAVRCSETDDSTCFIDGHGTVAKGDLLAKRPPLSGFVIGVPGISGSEKKRFQAYEPTTSMVQLALGGQWINEASVRDRPETEEEREAKEASAREQVVEHAKSEAEETRRLRVAAKLAAVGAVSERRAFALRLRDNYLASGQDIKVSVSGSRATTLKLQYPLINDVWLYQFQHNDEVMSALRSKGFEQLVLSDGWNYGMRLTL